MNVVIGKREFEMGGKYVTELRSSNEIMDDAKLLRMRMEEDGYVLIRGFHNRDQVMAARRNVLSKLQQKGRLALNSNLEDGMIGTDSRGVNFHGLNEDMPELLELAHSSSAMTFFDRFLGGSPLTYDHKWVRAVGSGEFSGFHYDVCYMGRGTKNVYTLWSPLGDVSYEMGGLTLCLGSQHFDKVKQTYGQMDVDRDNVMGNFSDDPLEIVETFGGQWATTEFEAGDVIIFGMYLLHGSSTNQTNRFRLSMDTRYQLASEPVDERWVGKNLKGHYAWGKGQTVTMEEARNQWGV